MNKLTAMVIAFSFLVFLLIGGAFVFLYLSSHTAFEYSLTKDGQPFGSVKVDRYVTENRVIFKSLYRSGFSKEAPEAEEKLTMFKNSRTPAKYIRVSRGTRGLTRNIVLVQNGEFSDYLFLENPRFLKLDSFSTGEKTALFEPDNIMTYMAVLERYNFWKKGSQFFEIMIPVETTVPPMRDKMEIKYNDDVYVKVAGKRIEAESFSAKAASLPDIQFTASKYGHVPLTVEDRSKGIIITLTRFLETPESKVNLCFEKIRSLKDIFRGKGSEAVSSSVAAVTGPGSVLRVGNDVGGYTTQNVFFESVNMMLPGTVYKPNGKGPFPAVIFATDDGIISSGEEGLIDSLGANLASKGVVFFRWSSPDQDKTRGQKVLSDDILRIKNIRNAAAYLSKLPEVSNGAVYAAGYRGGGYLALKAASGDDLIKGCVLLGLAESFEKNFIAGGAQVQMLNDLLGREGLGRFQPGFIAQCAEVMDSEFNRVLSSQTDQDFFLGLELPEKAFKQYLSRRFYESILSFEKPLLLVVGRDEVFFDPSAVLKLKGLLQEKNPYATVAEFRALGSYMGKMEDRGGYPVFVAEGEVLGMVHGWVSGENR